MFCHNIGQCVWHIEKQDCNYGDQESLVRYCTGCIVLCCSRNTLTSNPLKVFFSLSPQHLGKFHFSLMPCFKILTFQPPPPPPNPPWEFPVAFYGYLYGTGQCNTSGELAPTNEQLVITATYFGLNKSSGSQNPCNKL